MTTSAPGNADKHGAALAARFAEAPHVAVSTTATGSTRNTGVQAARARAGLDHGVTSQKRSGRRGGSWSRALPLASAIIVTTLGAGIALGGLMTYLG